MPKKKELCEKFSKAKKNYVFKAGSTKNGVTKHWIIEEVGARDITATSLFYYLQKMMSYSPFVSPSSISFFKFCTLVHSILRRGRGLRLQFSKEIITYFHLLYKGLVESNPLPQSKKLRKISTMSSWNS